jgi:hypothetical protein
MEQVFADIVAKAGMEYKDGAARFNFTPQNEEQAVLLMKAGAAVKQGIITPKLADQAYQWVSRDLKTGHDPFARDAAGKLKHPEDMLNKPGMADELRGLYLITRMSEVQLQNLRQQLGPQMTLEKQVLGDDCVKLPISPADCRYVVKPATGAQR